MSTTLQIKSTDSNGKDYQKSITFVNSSCSAAALKEFAARFNALSTNTLVDTHVVRRNNVDDEIVQPVVPAEPKEEPSIDDEIVQPEVPAELKEEPSIEIREGSFEYDRDTRTGSFEFDYSGNGDLYVDQDPITVEPNELLYTKIWLVWGYEVGIGGIYALYFYVFDESGDQLSKFSGKIKATETENYEAAETDFEFNIN